MKRCCLPELNKAPFFIPVREKLVLQLSQFIFQFCKEFPGWFWAVHFEPDATALGHITSCCTMWLLMVWAGLAASGLQHPHCSHPGNSLQEFCSEFCSFPMAAGRLSSNISSFWFPLFLFLPYFVNQHPMILFALSVVLLGDVSLQRLRAEKGKFSFALDICISKFKRLKLEKKSIFLMSVTKISVAYWLISLNMSFSVMP